MHAVVGYDPETGKIGWDVGGPGLAPTGSVAPASLGEDSWKWLYLQPLVAGQE
jgi:phospholipid/cholesterol/gamma-HCH transport system substrate-binding protein